MKTVVLGPRPAELEALIERRRALGIDDCDEVWEGDYHVAPMAHPVHGQVVAALVEVITPLARGAGLRSGGAFNLGEPNDFRVPDWGYHREPPGRASSAYVPTAAIVIEVVSPHDETFAKFGFYARHDVAELVVAAPATQTVRCFRRVDEDYVESDRSAILAISTTDLADAVDWPD